MAKNKRVFELAKELGVQSKDVVAKCQAEDIPGIKNHMSSVSVGLAATITEWFSEGDGATAVETAERVDIETVRAKARKKASRKATSKEDKEDEGEEDSGGVATIVAEPEKAPPEKREERAPNATPGTTPGTMPGTAARKKAPLRKKKPARDEAADESKTEELAPAARTDDDGAPTAEAPPKQPVAEAPVEPDADDDETKPVMNIPDRPEEVRPVGPMLEQPTRTKLSGPKVIRIEQADDLPTPRSRAGRGAGSGISRGGPRGGAGAGTAPDGPDVASGRGGGRTSRRNKRRSTTEAPRRSSRGGMGTDTPQPFNWREQDLLEREERLNRSGGFFRTHRRDNYKRSSSPQQKAATPVEHGQPVKVEVPISVKDLSAAVGIKANDIIKKLFLKGKPVTINSILDADDALEAVVDHGVELEIEEAKTAQTKIKEAFADREMRNEQPRSPVVTILGHVDHGKTSLLDRIRKANVAEGEAGGITQATSAFRVPVRAGENDRVVTFLDTPGHEAFTEMRSRGAQVTDVVVLVVAADDGVMPQTVESINHAKAASVPIVVALNKIDKPEATDANIQRILGQLAEHELNPVEWGGATEVIRTSAIEEQGIQDLLEILDYQAELLELTADFDGPAQGSVIEAQLEEGRGPVARLLVQHGELRKGDFIVIGRGFGRVRDIVNDRRERIDEAGPSTPVAISGIDVVPDAGDKFYVVKSLKAAEAAATERRHTERQQHLAQPKLTLDNVFSRLAESEKKELLLIVKGDVQGSIETLRKTLEELSTEEVRINVLHAAVGGVSDSDITLAEASGAIVLGFNVTSSGKARKAAEEKGIDIRLYDVIYDVINDVRKAASGLLDPEHRLEVLGHAEVREVFKISRVGMVAGCYVTDGVIQRNSQIRVTREDIVVEKDRRLSQLKRFKDDVKEVRAGQECGMKIDGYDDIKVGDVLECYKTVIVEREI